MLLLLLAFSKVSVLGVHTAFLRFQKSPFSVFTLPFCVFKSLRFRCSHCLFAFSKVAVFGVHTAFLRFQKSPFLVFTLPFCVFKSLRFRCSHCLFAFSKVSVFGVHTAFLRFQSAVSKVSVFKVEQCERKAQTDTFLSVFV